MPVPELEAWRKRWAAPQTRALGVAPSTIADGIAEFTITVPYGDERDGDPLFFPASLTYAADIAAVAAVGAHVDPTREQGNGTASLFLNFVAAPAGVVRVRAEVGHWAAYQALVSITAHDAAGDLVAQGLSGYSLRPRSPATPVTSSPPATAPAPAPAAPAGSATVPPGAGPALLRLFGLQLEAGDEGSARLLAERSGIHLRGVRNSINGGIVGALGQSAAHACIEAALAPGERVAALREVSVVYLSAARGERTLVDARLLRKGGRIAVAQVEVRDAADGRLNAQILVSWAIEPPAGASGADSSEAE